MQVGDIVVMGTDGLFDNVFDKDVALMAARSLKVRPPHLRDTLRHAADCGIKSICYAPA